MTEPNCEDCVKLQAKEIAVINKLHIYHKVITKQEDEITELKKQIVAFENKWEEARLKLAELEVIKD